MATLRRYPHDRRLRTAFTLLELIITVGIMALIAALIVVALGGVRGAANRATSSGALRQMMTGYNLYTADNDQRLMPGYLSPGAVTSLDITAKTPAGVNMTNPFDVSSYVWRLAPYVDNQWQLFMTDYRNRAIESRLSSELLGGDRGVYADTDPVFGTGSAEMSPVPNDLGISRVPSFGLNAIYVGGDDFHGSAAIVNRNPFDNPGNKLAATRLSEVRNPAQLIVFAPVKHHDFTDVMDPAPISNLDFGSPTLRPAVIDLGTDGAPNVVVQWETQVTQAEVTGGNFDTGGGVPISRWGKDFLPSGHLDGSVTTERLSEIAPPFGSAPPSDYLQYLRHWSPWAVGFRE